MLQAIIAFLAASGATFYFSWSVVNDLKLRDLSHTRCAAPVTRGQRPFTFWFVLTLAAALALVFAWFALDAAAKILAQWMQV